MSTRVLRCDDGWRVEASRPSVDDEGFCGTAFTLGNGYLATRGSCPELGGAGRPTTLLAGLFEQPTGAGRPPRLVIAPDWLPFQLSAGESQLIGGGGSISDFRLQLDLREGTLTRSLRWESEQGHRTRLEITRLISLAAPHLCAERFRITPENYSGPLTFSNVLDASIRPRDGEAQHELSLADPIEIDGDPALALGVRTREPATELVAVSRLRGASAAATTNAERPAGPAGEMLSSRHCFPNCACGQTLTLDRVVAYVSAPAAAGSSPLEQAVSVLRQAPAWEDLRASQGQAWQRFWSRSGVEIDGDPETEWMVRFSLFHLWQCACENNRQLDASIGARGLHGEGYNGHVFWDTEIFMLPFYTMSQPEVSRALLMYRYRRLQAARRRAQLEDGIAGARFPWESADSGEETTPRHSGPHPDGPGVRILTGEEEIHITADVAHAVWSYFENTGDLDFFLQHGAEIILDTARFWAARLEPQTGPRGELRYELHGVIGPDEYHETVANNLYTNAMARWNLQQAVATGRELARNHPETWTRLAGSLELSLDRLQEWEAMAAAVLIPFDQKHQLYSQFDGFFDLEDGRDRCAYRSRWRTAEAARYQIVKQPDVLLALHLLPELADQATLARHLDYFEPRTTHESSLSPALHALFAAQASRPALGYDYLKKALVLDCTNCSGGSDAGVHAANLGGIWQALVAGFGGVRSNASELAISPCLPRPWKALSFGLSWRSRQLRLRVTHDEVSAWVEEGSEPVPLRIEGRLCWVTSGAPQVFPRTATAAVAPAGPASAAGID